MKTNQEMIRKMGNFNVIQRTKDGMFNATDLLKQWNNQSCSERKMDNFFASHKTNEFINTIIEREKLNTPKMVYLKTRGKKGGTWMHPMLFIDFAMWINPEFKYDVIKFVHDEMIRYRNEAGDAYRELSSAVMKIVPNDFMPKAMRKIGEALNWIIFNGHERLLRNKHGDESKQRELWQLEKKIADLINEGFITSYDPLINYLRKLYNKKNNPAVFRQAI
nr:MAG TPA: KilA protein [Caudoviricetes sp.]